MPDLNLPRYGLRRRRIDDCRQGTFGEIAEYVKKGLFHQHGIQYQDPLEKTQITVRTFGEFFDAPIRPYGNTHPTMMFWNVIGCRGKGEIAGTVLAGVQENQATDRENSRKN